MDAVITQNPQGAVMNCVRIFANLRDGREPHSGVEQVRSQVIFGRTCLRKPETGSAAHTAPPGAAAADEQQPGRTMPTKRLEGFSDAFLAIIITIMVLELRAPHGDDLRSLVTLIPAFLSYVLSFVYLGIYWNNHHHLLHIATRTSGVVLWANLNLLFWLSLFPFATAWMGENHFAPLPSAAYGFVLLMGAVAYFLLEHAIMRAEGPKSMLRRAVGRDWKGKLSPVAYLIAIGISFLVPWLAQAIYVAVALAWLIPDPRIERVVGEDEDER